MGEKAASSEGAFDIALTICPPWDVVTPPLGLAYVGNFLRFKGIRPKVLDLNIILYHEMNPEARDTLWKFDSFKMWEEQGFRILGEDVETYVALCVDSLSSVDTGVFGFSLYHANLGMSVEVARRLKQARPEATIIFGGPSCGDPFDLADIPAGIADYMINGEGELALTELLAQLKKGVDGRGIVGVSVPEGIFRCEDKSLIPDLDSIPFPIYTEFPLEMYTGQGQLRIIASRGCVARCRFCNENYYTGKYRKRSAENVFAEIMYHKERHGIQSFIFSDQEVNGNCAELEKLCDLIIDTDCQIHWSGQAIGGNGMTSRLLKKMQAAGCYGLDFGLESGSETVLRRVGKPFTAKQAENVLAYCHDVSIVTGVNIIVGFPGENEEELAETMAFLKRNRGHIDKISNISTCFVKPFSDFHFHPQHYGIHIPDQAYFWYMWEDVRQEDNRDNAMRTAKLRQVISFCEEWGIPVENTYYFN